MRLASAITTLPALLGLLGVGCFERTPEAIPLEKYRVDVQVIGDKGLDLGGIVVRFNDQDQRRTRPDGTLRVGYLGAQQSPLDIEVVLPSDLESPQPTKQRFTLQQDSAGLPKPIQFKVRVQRKASGGTPYVVVVETECDGQTVQIDQANVGATNREGYFSQRIIRYPGQKLAVTVAARGRCKRLECVIALSETTTLLNIEGRCPGEPKTVAAAPPAPPPPPEKGQELAALRSAEPPPPPPPPPPAPPPPAMPVEPAKSAAQFDFAEDDEPERRATRRRSRRSRRARRRTRRARTPPPPPRFDEDDMDDDFEATNLAPLAVTPSAPPPSPPVVEREPPPPPPPPAETFAPVEPPPPPQTLAVAPPPSSPELGAQMNDEAVAAGSRDSAAERPPDEDQDDVDLASASAVASDQAGSTPFMDNTPPPPTTSAVEETSNIVDEASGSTREVTPPEGSRMIRVACRPIGLDLYVDGALAVSDCSSASQAWVRPGVRKFVLKNPPGGDLCPSSRPQFIDVPRKGRTTPKISVSTSCEKSCTEQVREALRKGKPTKEDVACLSDVGPRDRDFLDARLLRAHAHLMHNEIAEAERVLSTVAKTRRGRTDPEVRARLAEVLGRRKRLEEASREAETAWRYRMKFRGNRDRRETWILNVLNLRAGFFEQLFYRDRDRTHYERALETYQELERSAGRASKGRLLQIARASRARLESQEAQLLGE